MHGHTNIKLKIIIFKIKFTLLHCIEKLTLRCWLQKLHAIIIIISSTSAHNEPRLPLKPSSNTAYLWRPSPSSNPQLSQIFHCTNHPTKFRSAHSPVSMVLLGISIMPIV